tara:strand:- start:96 stop:599 length:504 start_codon:yes stop_codon:yes gene_type:complete
VRRQINANELAFFYQKTGEAIWHLQHVEDFLVKLYFVKFIAKKPQSVEETEASLQLGKLGKKTLGQLIGLLEKSNILSSAFLEKLKGFNNQRKWVVHNSNRESGDSLYTETGRLNFIERICTFTDLAIEIQKEIEASLLQYVSEQGISSDEIAVVANRSIEKLQGNV